MFQSRNPAILWAIPVLMAACLFACPAYAKYSGGTGEPNDPYQIATAADLMLLGDSTADYSKHFILTADIDLDPNFPGRKVFTRAVIAPHTGGVTDSFRETPFTGVFDGNGHTISHLTVKGIVYLGLFGQLAGEVMDLGVIDVKVVGSGWVNGVASGRDVGGLVGDNNGGTVTQCYSTGTVSGDTTVGGLVGSNLGTMGHCYSTAVVSGEDAVGGLAGFCQDGNLTECYSAGAVSGSEAVGGLVGYNGTNATATQCYSTGVVNGSLWVGGLAGYNWKGTLARCYSTGEVSGEQEQTGGLVGRCDRGVLIQSYSTAAVSGQDWVGGLAGQSTDGTLTQCYSTGEVSGRQNIGGLVGRCRGGTVAQCYSAGMVSGSSWVGGLAGNVQSCVVSDCFWDTDTSGQTISAGGTGKTTAEMQTAATFLNAGWDFVGETANGMEDIWWINEGKDYPRLVSFGGPLWAFFPDPPNGSGEVTQSPSLGWHSGEKAAQHDVYFGEDENAVRSATPASLGIYRGRQPMDVTTYDPGVLELGKTYYWRVDEVNEGDSDSPWKGSVWSFTTADYNVVAVVDDFESYTDDMGAGRAIFQTWLDGYGFDANHPGNGTGSFVGNVNEPFAEQAIVHGGRQSMPMDYNDVGKPWYSQAQRTWATAQNWRIDGADTLTLYFRGKADNSPEPLYVRVEDTSGDASMVIDPDPNAVLTTQWQKWHIALSEVRAVGVDLAAVKKMWIGVGDRKNPKPGGTGRIYVDDIRLTRRMP